MGKCGAGEGWGNVMLERGEEDQLNRSCDIWSVTESQGAEEYPAWNGVLLRVKGQRNILHDMECY